MITVLIIIIDFLSDPRGLGDQARQGPCRQELQRGRQELWQGSARQVLRSVVRYLLGLRCID